mmetsp:Transcript_9630/g.31574  ORF Transcript_9630/g.31574 Transcript_9630/m.31574 type:complete len:204 (-) Transcript_9630:1898-2509(-)
MSGSARLGFGSTSSFPATTSGVSRDVILNAPAGARTPPDTACIACVPFATTSRSGTTSDASFSNTHGALAPCPPPHAALALDRAGVLNRSHDASGMRVARFASSQTLSCTRAFAFAPAPPPSSAAAAAPTVAALAPSSPASGKLHMSHTAAGAPYSIPAHSSGTSPRRRYASAGWLSLAPRSRWNACVSLRVRSARCVVKLLR